MTFKATTAMSAAIALMLLTPGNANAAPLRHDLKPEASIEREFIECEGVDHSTPPQAIRLGTQLGAGITEPLTPDLRIVLAENGKPVPESAVAIRHMDNGQSLLLDASGNEVEELVSKDSKRNRRGIIPEEAKEIIAACLGVAWQSGPLAEAIFREVFTVRGAIKFLVRRIGLGAAIGCVGGIIWHYL